MNAILTEFVGTCLLLSAISYIGTPLAIGFALFVAVLLGGPISGGHFNPAVTLWAYLSHKIASEKAMLYVVAQLAAAVIVFLSKA
jgi:aquaporin Z